MPEYDNRNTIAIFKNDKKGNENAPSMTGRMFDENGKEWRVALWTKVSKNGTKYLQGKVNEPMHNDQPQPAGFDLDSEVPF